MASAPTRRWIASISGQVSTQLKSPPAEKMRPSPPTTSTRTESSAAHASTVSRIARAVSASSEFIASGRLRRSVATPSSMEVRTVSLIRTSHPEHAELGLADRLVHRRRQCQRQGHARVGRIEDAVVPDARGGVVWMALALVGFADRFLERLFLVLWPLAALGLDIVAPYRRQHAGRLLPAHDRDARVGPHPEEAGAVGAAAHAVIAGTVAAAHDHRELRHVHRGDRRHHLGAVARDAARLVFTADHEAGDVLQEDQRDAALATQLDEMCGLQRRLVEQDAIVGDDADRIAPDTRET